jgi:hypothetical protein
MAQTLYLGMPVLAFDKALILSLAHEPGALVFAAGPVLTASVPLPLALAVLLCQAPLAMSCVQRAQHGPRVRSGHQGLLRVSESAAPPLRRPGPRGLAAIMWQPSGHLLDHAVGGPLEDVRCVLL